MLDVYYLGLDRKAAKFNRGVGQEVRHSIGARLSRPVAQRSLAGISTMKGFGNSEASDRQISGHGLQHRKPVTDFRLFR